MESAPGNTAEKRKVLPKVVAHRGNAREFPENSIAALRSAIELGAQFVEFDVHLSADEVPIVIHDDTLIRTAGRPECVFDLSAQDLLKVEVAERDRFEDRFSDIHIPSLEQVTELLAAHPQVTAFVEIKCASLRRFGHNSVVTRISQMLKPVRQQCVVISFDLPAVIQARRLGAAGIGWVLEDYDERSRMKYEALTPEYIFCDQAKLPENAQRLWRGPWRWAVYEVLQVADAVALAARGVTLVETMAVRSLLRGLAMIDCEAT